MNEFKRRTAPLPAIRDRQYNARHFPQPPGRGPNGRRFCRWCHAEVAKYRSTFCSDDCADEFNSIAGTAIRLFICRRDGGRCVLCGNDFRMAFDIRHWAIEHARDLFGVGGEWQAVQAVIKLLESLRWSELEAYEIDHIIPLAEGGLTHPDNLRTLCVLCHQAETAKLRTRIASARRNVSAGGQLQLAEL